MRRQLAGMLKHFDTNTVSLTKMYEKKLDATKLHYSECTSLVPGLSLRLEVKIWVSSAYKQGIVNFKLFGRSFMKIRKREGQE